MDAGDTYRFSVASQLPSAAPSDQPITFQIGGVQKGEDAVAVTLRTRASAKKMFKYISKGNSSLPRIAEASIRNLCDVRGLTVNQLHELFIDQEKEQAYLFTAQGVLKVALNERFERGKCDKDDYETVFNGTKEEFIRHGQELGEALLESTKSDDFSKFIALLANPLTQIPKKEVTAYMQQKRHALGAAVVTCRSNGQPGEPAVGAFQPVVVDGNTLYCVLGRNDTTVADEVRLYELHADPADPNSPLVGYCRIDKNKFSRDKALSEAEIGQEVQAMRDRRTRDTYEVGYIKIYEAYQGRGLGYLLLHRALSHTLDNSAVGTRITLLNQAAQRGTMLYATVGEYKASDGSRQEDFKRQPFGIREMAYFREEPKPQ